MDALCSQPRQKARANPRLSQRKQNSKNKTFMRYLTSEDTETLGAENYLRSSAQARRGTPPPLWGHAGIKDPQSYPWVMKCLCFSFLPAWLLGVLVMS